jgi:hypothetical protein
MKPILKSLLSAILMIVLFNCIHHGIVLAQDNPNVKEPPIPVYMISSAHEDSLSPGNDKNAQVNNQLIADITKKIDTLQQQVHKSSAESTVHFIWLYTLVALLGIMNIVQLYSTSRIRKELAQMKRLEHQKMLFAAESPVLSPPPPAIQEPLLISEQEKIKPPVRTRKTRTTKPRVKKEKKT